MKSRFLLLTAAVAATLIIATGSSVDAAGPEGGFRLTGADAAYADWIDQDINGCRADLFVGYVDARALQSPLGSMPHPHADLQAILTVSCNGANYALEGVLPLKPTADPGCYPDPTMESLDNAVVDCQLMVIDGLNNNVAATLAIDLTWTANGDVFRESNSSGPGSHASHRTRWATVAGEVDVAPANADLSGLTFDGSDAEADSRITHFNQIERPD